MVHNKTQAMHTKQYVLIGLIVLVAAILAGFMVKFLVKETFNLQEATPTGTISIKPGFSAPKPATTPKKA